MKFVKTLCIVLTTMFLWTSCNEDKVKKENFVFTVDASQGTLPGFYIILSDESGNTVAIDEVKSGQKYDLKIDGEYRDKTFMVTEVAAGSSVNESYATINSYTSLPAENQTWVVKNQASSGSFFTNFTFFNIPVSQASVVAYTNSSLAQLVPVSPSAEGRALSLSLKNNSTYVLGTARDFNGQVKYRLFTNSNAGYSNASSNLIDMATVTTPLPTKTITHPSGSTSPLMIMRGILKSGTGAGTYQLPNVGTSSSTSLTPDFGTLFDDYAYRYSFTIGNYLYLNNAFSDMDLVPLPVTVTGKTKSSQSVTYSTTGSFDYARISFYAEEGVDFGVWNVYAPAVNAEHTISLPKIPSDVITRWKMTDPTKYILDYFIALDIKLIEGYLGFMITRNDAYNSTTTEYKSARISAAKL